jgi:hypothetical protein
MAEPLVPVQPELPEWMPRTVTPPSSQVVSEYEPPVASQPSFRCSLPGRGAVERAAARVVPAVVPAFPDGRAVCAAWSVSRSVRPGR